MLGLPQALDDDLLAVAGGDAAKVHILYREAHGVAHMVLGGESLCLLSRDLRSRVLHLLHHCLFHEHFQVMLFLVHVHHHVFHVLVIPLIGGDQGLREAEHGMIYDEFNSKQHEILTGTVVRIDQRSGSVTVRLGSGADATDAVLPLGEQVSGEEYYEGQLLKVYLMDVRRGSRGPQMLISRTHPGLVKRLFELEVPEIFDGTVEIRSIAREAGSRTKMAVYSSDENVDPIGACVGPRGQRVNAIVEELRGEKIDIVPFSEDPAQFVASALAPADVISVQLAEEGKACRAIVPDDQLSLAIGKEGQNARLAARLTGYKIDIKPASYHEEAAAE